MTDRVVNFSAGPATLPPAVLEEARRDLVSLPGVGVSPLEISHRSPWFEGVIGEAEANIRHLLAIPEGYLVLFLQGGATMQFAMAPMNLLPGAGTSGYVVTGSWGAKALAEAARLRSAAARWDGRDEGYVRVPAAEELRLDAGDAYLHITSNETIHGVEWPAGAEPATPVLVGDTSSDFLSRPIDVSRYGLLYAGAQKNAGPAGVTVVIVRESLLERIPEGLPRLLDYRTYAEHGSLYNTPPVFAIYVVVLVTRWLRDEVGGLEAQAARNRKQAGLLYERIDASGGFYRGHAAPDARSLMNVTWRLPSPELDGRFVAEAAAEGLVELKGHRSVGGIRASIYNAMPLEGVRALASFMDRFMRHNG
jgi:phosphoserine aminotransferase